METIRRARGLEGLLGAALLLACLGGAEAQTRPEFDHDATAFPLFGAHERTSCESCHTGGRFEGTPTDCGYCHDGTNKWAVSAKHPGHFPTGADCGFCHTARSWEQARMDHGTVSSSCESCHNGGFAEGKPPVHPASSERCGDCHRTLTWAGARFDHSNVTTACFTCHNGVDATGKHTGHVASSNDCQLCHSTRSWIPARFDHSNVTGSCRSCHDGITATGTPNGHFLTSLDCSACHSTLTWDNADYAHGAGYPDHGRGRLDCRDCHGGNSDAVTWSSPAYQPDCAGCHARDFRPGPHKKWENPDTFYTVGELRNCSGSCHVYTDSTLTTIRSRRGGPEHRPRNGGFD